MGLNITNTTGKTSGRKSAITIIEETTGQKNAIAMKFDIKNEGVEKLKESVDSIIRNKGVEELKKNAKIGLKI